MKEVRCEIIVPSAPAFELRLPPTPGRIFRVTAGLADWTPEEREWLKQHPGLIAYQDQLQATLEDVQRELRSGHVTEEEEFLEVGSPPAGAFHI